MVSQEDGNMDNLLSLVLANLRYHMFPFSAPIPATDQGVPPNGFQYAGFLFFFYLEVVSLGSLS
jgi:hypothetical protein